MSLWDSLFNRKKEESEVERNRQLPSSMVNEIFGEVDVRPRGANNEI